MKTTQAGGDGTGPGQAKQEMLLKMYRTMVRIRAFEEAAGAMIEAGEIKCPCHLYIGQEAIAAGVCATLEPQDTLWGAHRSHGHYIAKGGSLDALMAEMLGKATGCSGGRGGSMHTVAKHVGILGTVPIVGATVPLSVGAGLAAKLCGERFVSVAFFGDGTVEEGHVHESLNLAALYQLPVIFVCENNFYASHMHLSQRRVRDNLYEIGELHGMPALREDGNDVMAVYSAAEYAAGRARNGSGPTFLEFRTFRWRGHVGASWDINVGVKRSDELKDWLPKDPIARTRKQLGGMGVSQSVFETIGSGAQQEVQAAVAFARESPLPEAGAYLEHVFAAGGKGSK